MSTIPAYPLQWPTGWKRTSATERKAARFVKKEREYSSWTDGAGQRHNLSYLRSKQVSIREAVDRARSELARMSRTDDISI